MHDQASAASPSTRKAAGDIDMLFRMFRASNKSFSPSSSNFVFSKFISPIQKASRQDRKTGIPGSSSSASSNNKQAKPR
ncbi:MAG: hypothetical protein EBS62_04430 [Betaproteobacteria bacterium]|nr:hypothetical protein [Betaproteobacteria bacterium]